MSNDRIAVVGATGMLGAPVARHLRDTGWRVRCLVRDEARARAQLGDGFEFVVADVERPDSLPEALADCSHLHISLRGGNTIESYWRQEVQGARNCAAAARHCGVQRISYLSGSGRSDAAVARYFPVRVKSEVESALAGSAIPWTALRATHFMESLPQFVRDGRATVLGHQPHRLHYLAADDYAVMVGRALQTEAAANRALHLWGPEAWTMREAVDRYVRALHTDLRVSTLPLPLARLIALLTRNPDLRFAVQLFAAFAAIGEDGDPAQASRLLGAATTTLDHWLGAARQLPRLLLAVHDGAALLDTATMALRPANVEEAYRIADTLVAALQPRLGTVAGYKLGATSARGQALLGIDEPFYGRCFARRMLHDGAEWIAADATTSVEAEVGFELGMDLPPRSTTGSDAYSFAEVAAAVARALPVLEINRPAFVRPLEIGAEWLIADNGVTQALVLGTPGCAGGIDLSGETVRLDRNGAGCAEGSAQLVLGDPLRALHWLANALARHGRGLRRGDIVASGAMTPAVPVAPGDHFVARFSTLGGVRLHIGHSGAAVMGRSAE